MGTPCRTGSMYFWIFVSSMANFATQRKYTEMERLYQTEHVIPRFEVKPMISHVISFPIALQMSPFGIKSAASTWDNDWMRSEMLRPKIKRREIVESFKLDRRIMMMIVRDAVNDIDPEIIVAMMDNM